MSDPPPNKRYATAAGGLPLLTRSGSPLMISSSSGGSPRSDNSDSGSSDRTHPNPPGRSPTTAHLVRSDPAKINRAVIRHRARAAAAAASTGPQGASPPRRSIREEIESLTDQPTPDNIATLKRLLAHYNHERELARARISGRPTSGQLCVAQFNIDLAAAQNPTRDPQAAGRGTLNQHITTRLEAEQERDDLHATVSELLNVLRRFHLPNDFRVLVVSLKEHLMSLVRANRWGSG